MKAVILVGGQGTRLRPLTSNTPKPMVPIINRPFLEHMIQWLKSHGFNDIILALFYLPDRIQSHFGDGSGFGVHMTYVVEPVPLGTAGAVKNVEEHLDDGTFAVLNGDVITALDLTAMLSFHQEKGAKATIALTPVDDPTAYGVVETDSNSRVTRFIEKPSWDAVTTNLINAGTYILEPEVLSRVPKDMFFMFERGLFPPLVNAGEPVFGYASDGYWLDIGTPDKYMRAHHDLLMGLMEVPFPGDSLPQQVWAEEGCQIDPWARLVGPVVIGRGCTIARGAQIRGPTTIGDHCTIGAGSLIEDCVLWPHTKVGERAVMRRCVVGDHCQIGDGVWLIDGTVVGDHVIIGRGNKLEHGIRIWPGRTLEPETITF